MRNLIKYFKDMMKDSHGSPSSKRYITLLATVLVSVAFLANLFYDLTIEEFMFTSMMYIVIAGLGFTGAEKFASSSMNVGDATPLQKGDATPLQKKSDEE